MFKACGSIQPLVVSPNRVRCDSRAKPIFDLRFWSRILIYVGIVVPDSPVAGRYGEAAVRHPVVLGDDGSVSASEAALRRAAFGAGPVISDRALATAMTPRSEWLAAVVLGARGRYAAAAALLCPLIRGRDPLLAALAGAAFASHRRQLGGHAAALPLDGAALAWAGQATGGADEDGLDPAGAFADALLGLAADNLALGRFSAAQRMLDRARSLEAGWRAEVRACWVGAELALARGAAVHAVLPAKRAVRASRERGAIRHAVKSELVLAAALAATGVADDRDRAGVLATAALEEAQGWGLRSLTWPARLLAADLDPVNAEWNRSRVTGELHALLSAADPAGKRLAFRSPWVPI